MAKALCSIGAKRIICISFVIYCMYKAPQDSNSLYDLSDHPGGRHSGVIFCDLFRGESVFTFLHAHISLADPYRAGDGPSRRRATLVQATNPRCVLHPTSTCLPKHSAPAVPWRESNTATAEYVVLLSLTRVTRVLSKSLQDIYKDIRGLTL